MEFLLNSFFSLLGILSIGSILFVLSVGVLLFLFFDVDGVLSDFLVSLGVHFFNRFGLGSFEGFVPLRELFFEIFRAFFLEVFHVVVNMGSENSLSVDSGIVGFFFVGVLGETGESLGVVRDVHASINGSFQGSEDSVTGGGGNETDIEDGLERLSSVTVVVIDGVVFTINLGLSFVVFVKTQFVQKSSGAQKTSGVASSVVSQTLVDSVFLEFRRLSFANDFVTLESGIDDLANNLVGGNTGDKSILGGVVFIFVLNC